MNNNQWIKNACNTNLNANSGTLPDMSGALLNYFQQMTFGLITKTVTAFQINETVTEINFMGVWQPLHGRQIAMKPEGERAWNWIMLHSDPSLNLKIDDIVTYLGKQYRIANKKDYSLYQYLYWELVSDWINSGPPTP